MGFIPEVFDAPSEVKKQGEHQGFVLVVDGIFFIKSIVLTEVSGEDSLPTRIAPEERSLQGL